MYSACTGSVQGSLSPLSGIGHSTWIQMGIVFSATVTSSSEIMMGCSLALHPHNWKPPSCITSLLSGPCLKGISSLTITSLVLGTVLYSSSEGYSKPSDCYIFRPQNPFSQLSPKRLSTPNTISLSYPIFILSYHPSLSFSFIHKDHCTRQRTGNKIYSIYLMI